MDNTHNSNTHNSNTHNSNTHNSNTHNSNTHDKTQVWVGIDVSKTTLDVCLLLGQGNSHFGTFDNAKKGYVNLLKWVKRLVPHAACHFCMESTGAYSTGPALFLTEAGHSVSVVNPFRVKHAALAQGAGNKTDRADAKIIADYCRKENPPVWRLAAPEVRELVALVRHRDNLVQLRTQQTNRLQEPEVPAVVRQSLQKLAAQTQDEIEQTQDEIEQIENLINRHIDQHPGLRSDYDLLMSIPGIGQVAAVHILAELPDIMQFASGQSAAAYAGLNPQEFRSGTSVKRNTRLSKRGNSHLRAALYMPAIAAVRFNPFVAALAERLRQRGKSKMAVLGAAMRKLLIIAFGVLKSQQPFNKNYLSTRQKLA